MRSRNPLSTAVLGSGLLGLLLVADAARADVRWVETSGLVPTASVVEIPRTYLVPSSTVRTTSTYIPTSTVANVYVDAPVTYGPTGYVTTSYYLDDSYTVARPGYRLVRPRRYYERAYVTTPRTLVPTYYVTRDPYLAPASYVASSLCCEPSPCDDGGTTVRPSAPAPAAKAPIRETRASAEFEDRQPKAIDSSVAGEDPGYRRFDTGRPPARDEGVNSASGSTDPSTTGSRAALPAGPLDPTTGRDAAKSSVVDDAGTNRAGTAPAAKVEAQKPVDPSEPKSTPPARTPVAVPDPAKAAAPKPAAAKSAVPDPSDIPLPGGPPVDETTPPDLPPVGDPKSEIQRRDALKPVVPTPAPLARSGRNILQGRVVSADTRREVEGVEVIVTDKSGQLVDRTTRTDAFGKFAISLPEGDWTIKLTMPSGRRLAVGKGEITVASGRIVDMYGRDLTNLVIQR